MLNKPGIRVLDLVGTKICAIVVYEDGARMLVKYPGVLDHRMVPLEGGQRFEWKAKISPISPYVDDYLIEKTAIRGQSILQDAVYVNLYAGYMARAAAGEYKMNPAPKPEVTTVVIGDGSAQTDEKTIATIAPGALKAVPAAAPVDVAAAPTASA